MGAPSFSRTRLGLPLFLRSMVAYLGLPPRQTSAVFWHVFPAEPSGPRINAPVGPTERTRLDLEDCRAGMQYWGRSLFNPLGHPVGAAGLKRTSGRGGHFARNAELRRERRLRSQHLPGGRCFDFRAADRGGNG